MSLNLRSFHQAIHHMAPDEVVSSYSELATIVAQAVQDNRGNVDSFNGDHFWISFNAAGACALHSKRAVATLHRIVQQLEAKAKRNGLVSLRVTAGIAAGPALVGNLGCDAMKRACGLGPVYAQAAVLERMCKHYTVTRGDGHDDRVPAQLLLNGAAIAEAESAFLVQVMDLVRLPGADTPSRVAAFMGEVKQDTAPGGDGEWLYVVGQASPFAPTNTLFSQLENRASLAGDAAAEIVAAVEKLEAPVDPVVVAALKSAVTRATGTTDASTTNFGSYYATCVL
jgi:class 3 adenylate cyclase